MTTIGALVSMVGGFFSFLGGYFVRHYEWLTTPHGHDAWNSMQTLFWPWLIQFVMSWVGFGIYIVWDYNSWKRGTLETDKLPSRHPIHEPPIAPPPGFNGKIPLLFNKYFPVEPFWYSQMYMVPLVLFNQLVVWPLVSFLFVWPQWEQNRVSLNEWPGGYISVFASLIGLMLISDQMWYWSHRLMHVPWCWKYLHRMHHVAPQSAISATYVHPLEYTLFCIAMQLPYAVTGFPMWVHAVPLGWGMLTGSGAHSGYGGDFANGEKHGTGHHLYHSANFGLLMIADAMYGTHWSPGDPKPQFFDLGVRDIEKKYHGVWGSGPGEEAKYESVDSSIPEKGETKKTK